MTLYLADFRPHVSLLQAKRPNNSKKQAQMQKLGLRLKNFERNIT
jgi:hypothetical protein